MPLIRDTRAAFTVFPPLLSAADPPPFTVHHPHGKSAFMFLADHAGQTIPAALNDLGLPAVEINRHIGWDIGIAAVTLELAQRLDAVAILQSYSRLVVDCNRPLDSPTLIPEISDGTCIPGNRGLNSAQRQQRIAAIHAPYHARISAELDARQHAGLPTLLIMMHSFTPVMNNETRPWHAGVLYHRDARLAKALQAALQAEGLCVGDNQPYAVSDATDYAVPVHGEQRALPHVALEIRQDLITQPDDQQAWVGRLETSLRRLQALFLAEH